MSKDFDGLYAQVGRPSIPPERLLRALLLQVFYSVRSERLLMEQLNYKLLFRWFVGLEIDEEVWIVDCLVSPLCSVTPVSLVLGNGVVETDKPNVASLSPRWVSPISS